MDNKTFIEELSRRLDISRETVMKMIDSLSQTMGNAAAEMDSITISGFGVFEPRLRQERISIHPASGKKLLVPPKVVLTFKSAPVFKQKLKK